MNTVAQREKTVLFTFFGLSQLALLLFLTCPAFAELNDFSPANIRREQRANQVKVQGDLSCNLGAENNGSSCILKIRDSKTGKTFNLSEQNNAAMRLYHSGTTQVAVEGSFSTFDTIEVTKVSAL